jgi:hypothetical protein
LTLPDTLAHNLGVSVSIRVFAMSKVTRLPPYSRMFHVEADIPVGRRDEFERAIVEIIAGERPSGSK